MEACRREMGSGRSSVGGASADKNSLHGKQAQSFFHRNTADCSRPTQALKPIEERVTQACALCSWMGEDGLVG